MWRKKSSDCPKRSFEKFLYYVVRSLLFVANKDWLLLTESGQVVNKEWRVPHQTHFSAFSIVPDLRGLHTPL